MTKPSSADKQETIPDILMAMGAVHQVIENYQLDRKLSHLILLRASQINRCAYCIEMHTREARRDGESQQRLDTVIVFDQVDHFSRQEKRALAWTEALTYLEPCTDFSSLRKTLKEDFSETDIDVLTSLIAMINLWNRVRRAGH